MNVLDLFSGIGGFSLGLERAGMETIAFCEIDPYCREVLRKHWPNVPIYDDIHTLDKERLNDDGLLPVDVICGGFPCQPYSVAGQQRGEDDDRHLWPEMLRIINEIKPTWVIGENVAGLIPMALDGVLSDLEGIGYEARTFVIPACAVNAPHRRNRVWIVANSASAGRSIERRGGSGAMAHGTQQRRQQFTGSPPVEEKENEWWQADNDHIIAGDGKGGNIFMVETDKPVSRSRQFVRSRGDSGASHWDDAEWIECHDGKARRVKPGVRLLANGVPRRLARLRALGNAVVPQMPEAIGRAIMVSG